MGVIEFLVSYILIINFVGFSMMGIDKKKAIKQTFRIPESSLFTVAMIGGSIGSILGMQLFRHKTRRWYFVYGMPAILIIQIIIFLVIINLPIQFGII
ncbi:MAG TPA: DUF1294 domain-containing protein [Lachnospiraceae bacterium]|nr:DUF1294 domain-containing protein [Lachnospiraceae bacterium]